MAIKASRRDERLESPGVRTWVVLLNALGFLLLLGIAIGGLTKFYYWEVTDQNFPAVTKFPKPRVQPDERAERSTIEAAQRRELDTYRWIDRKQGLIQIPIERAMQLLAAEGANAYAPLAPAAALASPSAGAERLVTPPQAQGTSNSTAPNGAPTTPKTSGAAAPATPSEADAAGAANASPPAPGAKP